MDASLMPYLTFNGNARKAMKHYHSILGGELTMQTFAESKMARKPEENDLITHAMLKSEGLTFMASDAMTDRQAKVGAKVRTSISGHDSRWLTKVFDGLSKGGELTGHSPSNSGVTPMASLLTNSAYTGW